MSHPNVLFQGFGGQFGVQKDRMDKSALTFQENPDKTGTNYTKVKPDIGKYLAQFTKIKIYLFIIILFKP